MTNAKENIDEYGDKDYEIAPTPTWSIYGPDANHPKTLSFSEQDIRIAGLGLLGENFIQMLTAAQARISCLPSCFSDSINGECQCGAEDFKNNIVDLLGHAQFWLEENEIWAEMRANLQKYNDSLPAGQTRVIPLDPQYWDQDIGGLELEDAWDDQPALNIP